MSFILGLDLGQAQDYSALVLVERIRPQRDETPGLIPVTIPAQYHVRFAHRWPLGTDYVQVTQDVARRLQRDPVNGHGKLVIDRTGVGAAVTDLFRTAKIPHTAIHVHGGSEVTAAPRGHNVPKRDIVATVQVLLQENRLQFARRMPLMETLVQEAQTFRARIDPQTAHDSYSAWREQDHDDLVFSLALACWWGEKFGGAGPVMVPIRW